MAVFVFAVTHLASDEHLAKYWPDGTDCLVPFCNRFQLTRPAASGSSFRQQQQQRSRDNGATPKRTAPEASRLGNGSSQSGRPPIPQLSPHKHGRSLSPLVHHSAGREEADRSVGSSGGGSRYAFANPALQPVVSSGGGGTWADVLAGTAADAHHSAATAATTAATAVSAISGTNGVSTGRAGDAGSGSSSAAATPPPPPAAAATGAAAGAASIAPVIVGYEVEGGDEPLHFASFPQRLGQQPCDFYTKTGTCKYGKDCCFDHPKQFAVPLTEQQLPYRAGEAVCAFYHKTQHCKFGAACKFHHPKLRPIYAGSAVAPSSS